MKKIYIILLIITSLIICYFFYNKVSFLNIIVEFDNLEPIEKKMPIYYKGFKIGKSDKIYPNKEYTKTFVKLKIKPANIKLPSNVKARIENHDNLDYINILYPDDVSLKKLSEGTIIKGTISKDIEDLLSDQINVGNLESLISESSNLIKNANQSIIKLGNIFDEINLLIKEIKPDIKATTANLKHTTTNLKNTSNNINSSINKETLEKSINNIKETTDNINEITNQIEKVSMPMINSTICETNNTMKNANDITCGIKKTLQKHFGLGRIIFGRPINNKK